MRDYQLISPSLDGILRHDSLVYDGISRPAEVTRLLDSPSRRGPKKSSQESQNGQTLSKSEQLIIEQYFSDLHGVFMKKFSQFVFEPEPRSDDEVKLQAMLQEMIKMKHVMAEYRILQS